MFTKAELEALKELIESRVFDYDDGVLPEDEKNLLIRVEEELAKLGA